MVDLPARGKSLIAQKGKLQYSQGSTYLTHCVHLVVRYLSWLSIPAKAFNVGTYRRHDIPQPTADFFDTKNPEGERLRHTAAEAAVADMIKWFNGG